MKVLSTIIVSLLFFSCNSSAQKKKEAQAETFKITKTDAQWQAQLTENQYNVLRKAGTERAFSSTLNYNHQVGTYICAACGTPVFESKYKFNSGTGWPSFDRAIEGNVAYSTDRKLGYTRTEEHCAICGGHLGHVFNDGPKTTGKRHCINGVALNFITENEKAK